MTDQPSTQEPEYWPQTGELTSNTYQEPTTQEAEKAERVEVACETCGTHYEYLVPERNTTKSTTQEAEKALEALQEVVDAWAAHRMSKTPPPPPDTGEALTALRSLRTQLEQERCTRVHIDPDSQHLLDIVDRLQEQHTKDREEIERLKAENMNFDLTERHTKDQERIQELEKELRNATRR